MEVCNLKNGWFQKIFYFLMHFGVKNHVLPFFKFSRQLGKKFKNKSCKELYCNHFELSSRTVAWKIADWKFFAFLGIFRYKTTFLPFFNFLRQPGRSVERKNCKEFLCSDFELLWISAAWKRADFKKISIFWYFR